MKDPRLVGMEGNFTWQDRDLKFDTLPRNLSCTVGEFIIDAINSVEDTKGNNGLRGSLIVTNLRILWVSHTKNTVNLSIGYDTIISINIRKAKSKLQGITQALCVLAKFGRTRYEFVFTSLVKNSPRLFTTVLAVNKSYESSRPYRDLKLRGSIIKDGELILLPQEKIVSKISGVWNLSAEHGNLGTFYLTNLRIVWKADMATNFNASLPYLQVKLVRIRKQTKFGQALVIETYQRTGGYILGFRIDPIDRLGDVCSELKALLEAFGMNPNFGVTFKIENEAPNLEQLIVPNIEEDIEIYHEETDTAAVAAMYREGEADVDNNDDNDDNYDGMTDGIRNSNRNSNSNDREQQGQQGQQGYNNQQQGLEGEDEDGDNSGHITSSINNNRNKTIMYDAKLGLAVERLPPNTTMSSLWRIS